MGIKVRTQSGWTSAGSSAPVEEELPPGVPFTVGNITGSGPTSVKHSSFSTVLDVRKRFKLTAFSFYAYDAATYKLKIGNDIVAEVVVYGAGQRTITGLNHIMPVGRYGVGLVVSASVGVRFQSTPQVDYQSQDYDFSAAGWVEYSTSLSMPFIYSGETLPPKPGSTLDSLDDVNAEAPLEGQALVWSDADSAWVPKAIQASGSTEPAVETFTVGDLNGVTTGNTWSSSLTNLTVRKAFVLKELTFYATAAETYSLRIGVETVATVTAAGGGPVSFTGLNHTMPVGTYSFGVDPATNVPVRYRGVEKIDYVGSNYDFTATGWTELAGTYSIPFIYKGEIIPVEVIEPNPLDALDDVDVSTVAPVDGQTLIYSASDGLWKPGKAAPTAMVVVNHGSDASVPRPDAIAVYWIGSVDPVNALVSDLFWKSGA